MHDAFISYASPDKPVADAACAMLERHGIRCWIAPRDVTPGLEWGAEIVRAIKESAVMVLIYSRNANVSRQVKREVERAVSRGIPVVPFRIEDVPASETLEFFISTPHWLDAITPPMEKHLQYLAETVDLLRSRVRQEQRENPPKDTPPTPVHSIPVLTPVEPHIAPDFESRPSPPVNVPSHESAPAGSPPVGASRVGSATQGTAPQTSSPSVAPLRVPTPQARPNAGTGAAAPSAPLPVPANLAPPRTRPPASPWRRRLIFAGLLVVAGGVYGVTRYLGSEMRFWVGDWSTDNIFQGLQAHWTLSIAWNGDYTSAVETRDAGAIRFNGNSYRMETAGGRTVGGAFRFENERTASISGPLGNATWKRDTKTATAGPDSPVGEWTASRVVANMLWTMTFRINANGQYELLSRAEDAGRFTADERRWHLYSTKGAPSDGTYERVDGRTISMRGPLGTAVWERK